MNKTLSLLIMFLTVLSFGTAAASAQTIEDRTVSRNITGPEKPDTDPEAAIEEIRLIFNLMGEFKPEELWSESAKNIWKLDYEIRLSDEEELSDLQSKVYSKYKNSKPGAGWMPKANKKFYKKRKNFGLFVAKGKLERTGLLSETNREIIVSIKLSPEIRDILARAKNSEEKPSFILSLKGKLAGKNPSFNYNKKYNMNFEYPLKFYKRGDSFVLYNTFGASITVKIEKSSISLDIIRS